MSYIFAITEMTETDLYRQMQNWDREYAIFLCSTSFFPPQIQVQPIWNELLVWNKRSSPSFMKTHRIQKELQLPGSTLTCTYILCYFSIFNNYF